MHEAQHPQTGIGTVGLVHHYAIEQHPLRLAEVEADHRYPITGANQGSRQDALLYFRTADEFIVWVVRKHRPDVRGNEADVRSRQIVGRR